MMLRQSRNQRYLVQKFGGTSVASVEHIRRVASRVLESKRRGHKVVVVVSAMQGETNRLLGLAQKMMPVPTLSEQDALTASGEQVTATLTALALQSMGAKSRSFLGHQVKILTNSTHGDARISKIETRRLRTSIDAGEIPVVAGFQGVDVMENLTTLGRGGSDTTAVAIAAALGDSECEIYTDVDGVYSADPMVCPDARKYDAIPYEHMLSLSSLGAKVLHSRSVAIAKKYQVPVHVRTSFEYTQGTWVVDSSEIEGFSEVSITSDRNVALAIWRPEIPTPLAFNRLIQWLGQENLPVDLLTSHGSGEGTEIHFLLRQTDITRLTFLPLNSFRIESDVAQVSIVGSGATTDPRSLSQAARLLAEAGVRILGMRSRETAFSFLIPLDSCNEATRALHDGFEFKV
jgi:aspartate kinase